MASKPKPIEPQELIPGYWDLTASSLDDIVFLGRVTVRGMVRYWRGQAESCSGQIKRTQERIAFLEGKTIADLQQAALEYDLPAFTRIGTKSDSWDDSPEPLDGDSINRRSPATTFNVCGWCKYCSGGTGRYGYMITTSCSLLTEVGIENWKDDERAFNSLCFIHFADDSLLDQLRAGLAVKKEEYVANKKEIDRKIRLLLKLEKQAEKKPALPAHRPHDWFNLNDPLTCFVGSWHERIVADAFATAKVIDGYRHHDGCVSVEYTRRVHEGDYLEGHGGGYGMSRPEIMHDWEFEYLLDHPEFAGVWTGPGTGKHLRDFRRERFLQAMAYEANVRKGEGLSKETPSRKFPLGDILSAITGVLVTPAKLDGVGELYSFMTGGNVELLSKLLDDNICAEELRKQFPQLTNQTMQASVSVLRSELQKIKSGQSHETADEFVARWLQVQIGWYGEELEVKALPEDIVHWRKFNLGDILSITTGHLVSPRGRKGMNEILDFMTGDKLSGYQLASAVDECKPFLVERYPQFTAKAMTRELEELDLMLKPIDAGLAPHRYSKSKCIGRWLGRQIAKYGKEFRVRSLPIGFCNFTNPIKANADLVGAANVFAINGIDAGEVRELGTGVLTWDRDERITDRYGSVWLMKSMDDDSPVPLDLEKASVHGKIVALVLETRESHHVGDMFRGVGPVTPEEGETIVLGEGTLFFDGKNVGLLPDDDRESDWLDIDALYRVHDQTVALYFVEPQAHEGGEIA